MHTDGIPEIALPYSGGRKTLAQIRFSFEIGLFFPTIAMLSHAMYVYGNEDGRVKVKLSPCLTN
jgi:hypothetical protein